VSTSAKSTLANLRKLARGKPCTIRLPGICTHDTETTVLCHVRMVGISGMSDKAADLLGAWGCAACHAAVDASGPQDYESRRAALLEGMARTIHQLVKLGVVNW
jgi:hypothetical protein